MLKTQTQKLFVLLKQIVLPQSQHFIPKLFADEVVFQSADEPTFVKKLQKNDFDKDAFINKSYKTLKSGSTEDDHVITNSNANFLSENAQIRRNLSQVNNGQDNDFKNQKLTRLGSFTLSKIPKQHEDAVNKKLVDDTLEKDTFLSSKETLER